MTRTLGEVQDAEDAEGRAIIDRRTAASVRQEADEWVSWIVRTIASNGE